MGLMSDHDVQSAIKIAAALWPPEKAGEAPIDLQERLTRARRVVESIEGDDDDKKYSQLRDLLSSEVTESDQILRVIGQVSLQCMQSLQPWLQRGLGSPDDAYILSIQDRQTINRLTQKTISSLLVPLGQKILASTNSSSEVHDSFASTVGQLLVMVSADDGDNGANERYHGVTLITAQLRSPSVLPIVLSHSILLGWSQSQGPEVFADVRKQILHILEDLLSPGESLSALGTTRNLVAAHNKRIQDAIRAKLQQMPATARVTLIDEEGEKRAVADALRTKGGGGWPEYVSRTLNVLMGKQVVRKGGVVALMTNVSGTMMTKQEVLDARRIDHLARVLKVVVPGWEAAAFHANIFDQLLDILTRTGQDAGLPDRYSHAACCILQTYASEDDTVLCTLKRRIHPAFLPVKPVMVSGPILLTPANDIAAALSVLLPLVVRAPPPVDLLNALVSPILPALFALRCELDADATADPITKQEIQQCLEAWVQMVDDKTAVVGIWRIITSGHGWGQLDPEGLYWAKDFSEAGEGGMAVRYGRPPESKPLATQRHGYETPDVAIRPDDRSSADDEDVTPDVLDAMDIRPPPRDIVQLTRKARNKDVATEIFIRSLTTYGSIASSEDLPRSMLFLRIVMIMSEEDNSIAASKPEQVLPFVEHALRNVDDEPQASREDVSDVADVAKLGLVQTALVLLVYVLESHQDINKQTAPLLHTIASHLEAIQRQAQPGLGELANAALLLMSVRDAVAAEPEHSPLTSTLSQYQEAVKLLQDPILPVRAHGLIMLQDIVKAPDFDRRLAPGILGVFLQALKDEDSYVYLNAINALSALVDGLGKEILEALIKDYVAAGDTDFKLRIGEALTQVIQRAGDSLSRYTQIVIPPLLRIFPDANLPTVIRSSALSILGAAIHADRLGMLPWSDDLLEACLDLIEIELVPLNTASMETSSFDPTQTIDSKHPVLRRAALVLVAELLESPVTDDQEHEAPLAIRIRPEPVARATSARILDRAARVLGYASQVDADDLVRHQASEVLEIIDFDHRRQQQQL